MRKAILVSDIHFDNADEDLVELVCTKFAKDFKPDIIILNGDIIDNYAVSRYQKHPDIEQTLVSDVERTKEFLIKLRRDFPNAQIDYIFGNHCHRLESYIISNAPELFKFINLEQILELKKLKINCIRSSHKENWKQYGNLFVGHYDAIRHEAGATAQYLLKEKGVSLVQGHVHRVGMVAKRLLDRVLYGYENPCLTSLSVDYAKDPNWQQGFSIIYFDGNEHWLYPVIIKDKQFIYGNKKYQA